jgi:phenylacetate-CoA ligase
LASVRPGPTFEVAQTLPILPPEVRLVEDRRAGGATQPATGTDDGSRLPMVIIRLILLPVDWVLRLLGPRYDWYFLFFRAAPPGLVAWLGRLRAVRAVDHAVDRTPAYRDFLNAHAPSHPIDEHRLRLSYTDKQNYINAYPIEERCLGGQLPRFNTAIDESSGSTGTPYNWIRSLEERQVSHLFISHFARYCFGAEPWITINAFSMGAWATGINMGIALQRCSVVKNTGPDLDKIFSTLEFFGPDYRYLVCGYPPFLKHMIDVAEERAFPIKQYHLMALLGGEGNSEGLRDYLLGYFQPVYSGYGATDIEIGLAGETPISVAIRREARRNQVLRNAVFGNDSRLPMLFQYNPMMHHVVANEKGELIFTITRLNVLAPRMMYNVHDEGGVATYAEMRGFFQRLHMDLDSLLPEGNPRPLRLPFLWVYGRKDSTISIMGANIYPEDIEQCLYDEPELAQAAHSFCLSLHEGNDGSVRPRFSFEIRGPITDALRAKFEDRIPSRLVSLNADFREATKEYPETVKPVIELFPMGAGPFAGDATRIKQARLLKA